jgi:hypothetical protein
VRECVNMYVCVCEREGSADIYTLVYDLYAFLFVEIVLMVYIYTLTQTYSLTHTHSLSLSLSHTLTELQKPWPNTRNSPCRSSCATRPRPLEMLVNFLAPTRAAARWCSTGRSTVESAVRVSPRV